MSHSRPAIVLPLLLPPPQLRIHELIQLPSIQHAFHIARLDARADVFHAAIVQHIVADLAAEADRLWIALVSLRGTTCRQPGVDVQWA